MQARHSYHFVYALVATLSLPAQGLAALTFELTTGDSATNTQSLPIDSNKCPTEGPLSSYVAGKLTNTGPSTVNDVQATISGLGGGIALTGTQSATLNLGAMASGAERLVGWHISYPCTDTTSVSATISVTDNGGGSDFDTVTLNVREAQSANAGGNVISTTLGPGAIVGQTITADVSYDFGNIRAGNEFILQPAGNTDFDAACLEMVGSEIIGSNIVGIAIGDINQLYFLSPIKQSGNGYFATVRFSFRYLCDGVTSTARPFAAQTSGGTNIKYTGNFDGAGALTFDFPIPTNPFVITKVADQSLFQQGIGTHRVTYTVTVNNPSSFDSVIDRFSDLLPSGVAFNAIESGSGVTSSNSGAVPVIGDVGTIQFTGISGISYSIPSNSSLTLIYSADVQDVSSVYTNSASAIIGSASIGSASADVTVAQPTLTVQKNVSVYDPTSAGLFMIPGNDIVYEIVVDNTGLFPATENSLIIIDDMPAEVEFFNDDFDPTNIGMGPFNFDPGTSGLTCCSPSDVEFSNTAGSPPSFGYGPAIGYDGDVSHFKLEPKGILLPGEQFSIQFRSRIE